MANVTGPASSTDTAIARWNGTSGTVIADSNVTVDGSGNVVALGTINGSNILSDSNSNVAVGVACLASNTTGSFNTAIGVSCLASNTTGSVNTAIGYQAMHSNTSGGDNVAVGEHALDGNISGSNNVAVGENALLSSTDTGNTAVGYAAGASTTGANTTAIGREALLNATGGPNTAVGSKALRSAIGGTNNVAFGYNACSGLSSGSSNTVIGDGAGVTIDTGDSNIIIGASVDVPNNSAANYLNIGDVIKGQMDTGAIVLANGFTATTQSPGNNSTKLATTAYVDAATSGGTVTSVAASGSQGVTISGSPITSSGTITVGLGNITPTSVAATGTVTGSNLSGTNTGDQTITLTGDVTGSGTGSFAATIKSSVALAGSPTTTTQSPGDNTTKVATTAFVTAAVSAGGGGTVTTTGSPASGNLSKFSGSTSLTNGDLSGDVTTSGTLVTAIKSSVALGGSPTTTTQSPSDNSTKIATTAYVDTAISSSAPVVYNVISGFLPSSIAGTHTTASLSLSKGQAADSTNTAYISKSSTISWAASNGNAINGTDAASSTLANSTTYHIFVCSGGSGTGSFVSASLTPTFPTGYNTYSRRVASFNTDSSGAPLPYTAIESEGGSMICWLGTQVLDINSTNTTSGSRTLYTLSTPNGIKTQWLYRLSFSVTGIGFLVTSGDETDVASARFTAFTAAAGCDGESGTANTAFTVPRDSVVTTNTSAQIGIRVFSATGVTLYGVTRGWKDFRRS